MSTYIGRLDNSPARDTCPHVCSQCGRSDTSLLFEMVRNCEIQVTRNGKSERYDPRGVAPGVIHADPIDDLPPVIPPAPPEVWLVYKHGGRYGTENLQGIYSSEEGAKESVRFAVKEERASLARRLGQPETSHDAPEPTLKWQLGHHSRYGAIPGEFHASAGLADFVVKRYKVEKAYLPDTKWCVVPMEDE
jgi:hypothetical protein